MKNIIKSFAVIGALSLLFASCNKDQAAPEANFVTKTITASFVEPVKTVIGQDQDNMFTPYFTKGEPLQVVGSNGSENGRFQFSPDADGTYPASNAKFICTTWEEGYEPLYAVSSRATTSVALADGKITVMTGKTEGSEFKQKISCRNSYGSRAATHIGQFDSNGNLGVLKNASSLLGVKVSRDDIKSIRVQSLGGEKLCGSVKVDCEKFFDETTRDESFSAASSSDMSSSVDVVPTIADLTKDEVNVFPQDEYFYIVLIPGTYGSGLRFTLTNTDGIEVTRDITSSLTFKTGKVRKIPTALDEGLSFKDYVEADAFLEEFTVSLDFCAGWPFEEEIVATDSQSTDGETYTYRYIVSEDAAHKYYKDIQFTVCKGPNGNTYTCVGDANGLNVVRPDSKPENLFYITIPAIEGRRVSEVTFVGNTNSGTYYVGTQAPASSSDKATYSIGSASYSKGVQETISVKSSEKNKKYYLYRDSSTAMYTKSLSLKYTNAAPEMPDIVISSGTSNVWYYKNGDDNVVIPTRTSTTSEPFWHESYPDYVFTPVDGGTVCFNGGIWFCNTAWGYIKLPNISGYRLDNVALTCGNSTPPASYLYTKDGDNYTKIATKTDATQNVKFTLTVPNTVGSSEEIYLYTKGFKASATAFTYVYVGSE